MIYLETQEQRDYLDRVRAFADKLGPEMREQLEEKLNYLHGYGCTNRQFDYSRCSLYDDRTPGGFSFTIECLKKGEYVYWMNGGLLYHGPHDGWGSGAGPTFAVTVTPTTGWSVHT